MKDALPTPVSLDAALTKFQTYLKSLHRSSATLIAYGNDLVQLKDYLVARRITQATTVAVPHLQDYVTHLSGNGYTPKSVSRKINSLKTFFKFLHQTGLNPANPAANLIHPKYATAPPHVLTPAEYRSLRDACRLDIRVSAIVELLLQTGIRISELANLHLDDFKKNELYIRPAESNPARAVPLSKSAAASVQNYLGLRRQVADTHLFVTKTGRPLLIRNIRTAIDRYFRAAGIKFAKVNDLRHTFVSHQLQGGMDPEILCKIVGHKRLTSTTKYLDFIKPNSAPLTTRLAEL